MHFRKLTPADSPLYRKVRLECLLTFPDNFGSTYEEESSQHELKFEKILREVDPNSFLAGAFDGDSLIGLCGFYREGRKKTRHRGEIVQMYIHPDYANKSLGTGLLKYTIEKALENPEVEQLILSLVLQNEKAGRVYEKLGFREYGRLTNYFKSGTQYWDQRFMVLHRADVNEGSI